MCWDVSTLNILLTPKTGLSGWIRLNTLPPIIEFVVSEFHSSGEWLLLVNDSTTVLDSVLKLVPRSIGVILDVLCATLCSL